MKFTIPLITLLSLLPVLVSGQDDPLACRNCKVDVDDADPRIIYSPAANWTHQTNAPKVQAVSHVPLSKMGKLELGRGRSFSTTIIASRAFNTSGEHTITITASTYGTAVSSSISLDRFRIDDGSVPSSTSSAKVSTSISTASPSATKPSASRHHFTQAGMAIAGFLMSLFLICTL